MSSSNNSNNKIIGIIGATVLALLLSAGVAQAQTTTPTTTPGTPDTGSGADMASMLLLGSSALIALGGAAYIARASQKRA